MAKNFAPVVELYDWVMMQKSKIAVSAALKAVLAKDAESFEFFKRDGRTINMNAFLSKLIVNYSETFRTRRSALIERLKAELFAALDIGDERAEEIARGFVSRAMRLHFKDGGDKLCESVSVKPTDETRGIFRLIADNELKGSTFSEYFRGMFESYAQMPQDEREKLIFADGYKAIVAAIEKGKKIFVTTKRNSGKPIVLAPYAVVSSKEEMHCYLLATVKGKCRPFRLSRIASAFEIDEPASFSDGQKNMFARMTAYAPQYIYSDDEKEAVIELTDEGIKLFKALFVHRPLPTSVDGGVYRFNCSYMQLKQYFSSFGKEAYVRKPKELRDIMARFHREADAMYKEREE